MSSKYPELFNGLMAKFHESDVKILPKGGKQLLYITARTCMNRLDDVLGPENWWDEYIPGEHSVMCRLSIRLPDGTVLTKCDAGGYAGMADQGDDDKSGFSDALKRAAAKFGVARYLYRDGVPEFEPREHHAVNHSNDTGHGSGAYADPETVKRFQAWAKEQCEEVNQKWLDFLTGKDGEIKKGPAEIVNPFQLAAHLVKWGRKEGLLNAPEDTRAGTRDKYAAVVWSRHPQPAEAEAKAYAREQWRVARAKLDVPKQPVPDDDGDDIPDEVAKQFATAPAEGGDVWPEGRE